MKAGETLQGPPSNTPPAHSRLILGSLLLGALAYGVLASVLVPALPFFESTLHTTESGVTWLLTAFFLSGAGSTALLGRLGDMYGKRRILLITLAILAVGILISAVSSSLALEIVGRALQGAAGGLFPLAFGIVRDELPQERVPGGIAALTGTISVGSAGVLLPGLLIPHASWHWLFWIPLILTLFALLGTWLYVRESQVRTGGTINWANAALMMIAITAVVFGISEGNQWGWSSAKTLGLLVGGSVVGVIWVIAELQSKNPVINMSLTRQRAVWTTNVFALMAGAGMYGAFAAYPVFAQLPASTGFSYGASLMEIGLYLLPLVVAMGIGSSLARHAAKAFSPRHALVGGSALAGVGFGFMALWNSHPYDMMISLTLAGAGFGVVLATLFTVVVHSVPGRNVGEVSGMNSVIRFVGGAAGTQVVATLISSSVTNGMPTLHGFVVSFVALAVFMAVGVAAAVLVPSGPSAGSVSGRTSG
ncbi:MFS transporter [Rudaeicoccus suwonensis]|uniref:MFS transporter n=2 Tax=Rudaeicoccus suwonensis TaxID=657409 RepID=A0A561E434_9MICO|nr:MFS transporter [Rudaeicoccus suwonensis]